MVQIWGFISHLAPPSPCQTQNQYNQKPCSDFLCRLYATVPTDVFVWIRCAFRLRFCHNLFMKLKVRLKVRKETLAPVFNFSDFLVLLIYLTEIKLYKAGLFFHCLVQNNTSTLGFGARSPRSCEIITG